MLRVIRRHNHEPVFQAMRVLVTYCKGQKQEKKFYIQKVPWPDNLSTTKCTQKNSRLLLQAIQWASSNSVHFFCATGYKVFGTVDKGKGNLLFDIVGKKSIRKIHAHRKLESKLFAIHIAETVFRY